MRKAGISVCLVQGLSPFRELRLEGDKMSVLGYSQNVRPPTLIIKLQRNLHSAPRALLFAKTSHESVHQLLFGHDAIPPEQFEGNVQCAGATVRFRGQKSHPTTNVY